MNSPLISLPTFDQATTRQGVEEVIDITDPPNGIAPCVGDAVKEGKTIKFSGGLPKTAIDTDATDNAASLIAIRDYCNQDKTKIYRLVGPNKIFATSSNQWMPNTSIIFDGPLFCTYASTATGSHRGSFPRGGGEIFRNVNYTSDGIPHTGYFLEAIPRGATTLTLKSLSDVTNFNASGGRLYLHSGSQQDGGYPPNSKWVEWLEYESLDPATGIFTLANGTEYSHSDTNYDSAEGTGQVRVIPLERPYVAPDDEGYIYPELIRIERGGFLRNPNYPLDADLSGLVAVAERVEYINALIHMYLWPQMSKTVVVDGGRFDSGADLDKNGNLLVIQNGAEIDSALKPATSWESVILNGATVRGHVTLASKSFVLADSQVIGDLQYGFVRTSTGSPVFHAEVNGNRVRSSTDMDYHVNNHIDNECPILSSTQGEFKVDVDADYKNFHAISVGTVLFNSNIEPEMTAVVTSKTFDGTDWVVKHTGSHTFTGSVYFSGWIAIEYGEGNVIESPDPLENLKQWKRWRRWDARNTNLGNPIVLSGPAETARSTYPFPVGIRPSKVTLLLRQASRAADTKHTYKIQVKKSSTDAWTNLLSGDCTTDGEAVTIDLVNGIASWSSGWTNKTVNLFAEQINYANLVITGDAGGNMVFADPSDAAVFLMRVY